MNTLVSLPIVAAMPTTAPAMPLDSVVDPIFAALEAFRLADAAFYADRGGEIPDEIGDCWCDALAVVLRTHPTTPAGLGAFTGFARNMAERSDRDDATLPDGEWSTVAAIIDDAVRGMSGLKAWSPPQSTEPDVELVAMGARFAELSEQHTAAEILVEPQQKEIERLCGVLRAKYGTGKIPKEELRAVRPAAEAKFPYPGPSVDDMDSLIIPLGEKINEMKAHTLAGFRAKALLVHHWPAIDLAEPGDNFWPHKVLRDLVCDLIGYDEPVKVAAMKDEIKLVDEYEVLVRKYIDARVRWASATKRSKAYRSADDEMCKISSKMDPFEDAIAKMTATSMTAFRAIALKQLRYSMPTGHDNSKLTDGWSGDLTLLRASLRLAGLQDYFEETEELFEWAINRRRSLVA